MHAVLLPESPLPVSLAARRLDVRVAPEHEMARDEPVGIGGESVGGVIRVWWNGWGEGRGCGRGGVGGGTGSEGPRRRVPWASRSSCGPRAEPSPMRRPSWSSRVGKLPRTSLGPTRPPTPQWGPPPPLHRHLRPSTAPATAPPHSRLLPSIGGKVGGRAPTVARPVDACTGATRTVGRPGGRRAGADAAWRRTGARGLWATREGASWDGWRWAVARRPRGHTVAAMVGGRG